MKIVDLINSNDLENSSLGLNLAKNKVTKATVLTWYIILIKEITNPQVKGHLTLRKAYDDLNNEIYKHAGFRAISELDVTAAVTWLQKNFTEASPESIQKLLEAIVERTYNYVTKKVDNEEYIKKTKSLIPILNGH